MGVRAGCQNTNKLKIKGPFIVLIASLNKVGKKISRVVSSVNIPLLLKFLCFDVTFKMWRRVQFSQCAKGVFFALYSDATTHVSRIIMDMFLEKKIFYKEHFWFVKFLNIFYKE